MPDSLLQSPLDWNRIFRPLGEKMSAQLADALTELRLGERPQRRYEELAAKNTEGMLTDEERTELEEFVMLNRLVSTLKAEASLVLGGKAAA